MCCDKSKSKDTVEIKIWHTFMYFKFGIFPDDNLAYLFIF